MMEPLEIGDVIAFHIADDTFGLAHVVHIEDLTTGNHYHLAVYDVAEALELDPVNPEESIAEYFAAAVEEEHPVAVDHVAVTFNGLAESGVVRVGEREVDEEELVGYQIWLHSRGELLMRNGLLRDDMRVVREEEPEEGEDDSGESSDGEHDEPSEQEGGAEEAPATVTIQVREWHRAIFDRSVGSALVEMREDVASVNEGKGALVGYLAAIYSAGSGAIGELVERFVMEGDYSAGHELVMYGDAAADALGEHLRDGMEEQAAEDILNILCDIGTLQAYEHIARFFAAHSNTAGDSLAPIAIRSYCYAVTLTGGTPAPLQAELGRLDAITGRDLRDDIERARAAVASVASVDTAGREGRTTSSDPFGNVA